MPSISVAFRPNFRKSRRRGIWSPAAAVSTRRTARTFRIPRTRQIYKTRIVSTLTRPRKASNETIFRTATFLGTHGRFRVYCSFRNRFDDFRREPLTPLRQAVVVHRRGRANKLIRRPAVFVTYATGASIFRIRTSCTEITLFVMVERRPDALFLCIRLDGRLVPCAEYAREP